MTQSAQFLEAQFQDESVEEIVEEAEDGEARGEQYHLGQARRPGY